MKRINAIVVDDEIGAVHTLRGMLEEYCPMVNIIAAANTVEQGVRVAKQYRPDIVFLDIEIPPNGNGFDFLRQTEDCDFNIIFTTAYAHYAIQAINDVQPVAYLVKPYRVAELVQAIHNVAIRGKKQAPAAGSHYRGIILGDMHKGNFVFRHSEILYCKADGPCTVFYVIRFGALEHHTVYRSLREVEEELPDDLFYRVHHSYLINMAHVHRFERRGRSGVVHLAFDTRVEVSQQKIDVFIKRFHEFVRGVAPGAS